MNYLKKYSDTLIKNGYTIIPILTGQKRPLIEDWTKLEYQSYKEMVADLGEEKINEHQGIGILCSTNVIGIDIDVYREDLVVIIKNYFSDIYGESILYRYGNRPKVLIPFQYAGKLTGKKKTPIYKDGNKSHMIEILRGGSQFVAFNTYGKGEYVWEKMTNGVITNTSILDVPSDRLPVIDDNGIAKLINFFNETCEELGLTSTSKSIIDEDGDAFGSDVTKVAMTNNQLIEVLNELDRYNPSYKDEHETWLNTGFALWHQTDGGSEGYDIWIDWSKGSEHFNSDEYKNKLYEKRWASFDPDKGHKNPITFRSIIYALDEAKYDVADKAYKEFKETLLKVTSLKDIDKICGKICKVDMPSKYREMLVLQVMEAYKRIGEKSPPASKLRPELAYDYQHSAMPSWCKEWVYASDYERFVNIVSKKEKSPFSFNAAYSRFLLESGANAVDTALNVYKIKNVDAVMYAPPLPLFIEHEGKRYLNTYRSDTIPEVPDELTDKQQWGVDIFVNHIKGHLLKDERDAELFLSWLATQVQHTGRKVGWACVLQGVQGDGKSTIGYIMRHVLGTTNVRIIGNKAIQGEFANWVTGYSLGVIEEVNIKGKNKVDLLNDLKQYITNDIVDFHKKGRDVESVLHFSNYLFLTNEEFAIPIDANDRRFFIMNSQYQNKKQLDDFIENNPKYYGDLRFVRDNPVLFAGAIRKFLLEYQISDEFKTTILAPINEAKLKLIKGMGEPIFEDLMRTLITSSVVGETYDLFSLTKFINDNLDQNEIMKYNPRWKHVLNNLGMTAIRGRVRLADDNGRQHTFYSTDPKKWTLDGKIDGFIDCDLVRKNLTAAFYSSFHSEDSDFGVFDDEKERNIEDL